MKPLSIHDIRKAVAGKAITPIPETVPPIVAVCTDTREMTPSSLFVAIKGDNHDAHCFIPDAAAAGAIAVLVQEAPAVTLPNVHIIQVKNTRVALGKLATM
jgi:UDP-N-acetylmuramoyl-tripeptide--D-alanyl-D-alanine ligase